MELMGSLGLRLRLHKISLTIGTSAGPGLPLGLPGGCPRPVSRAPRGRTQASEYRKDKVSPLGNSRGQEAK